MSIISIFYRIRRSTRRRSDLDQNLNQHRLPAYRQAIFRICQLQLKICSKLLEIAPNKPLKRQPKSLKHLAGSTILRPFRFTDSNYRHSAIERLKGRLPSDLINFLHTQ
jgi:hypothetical protein